MPPNHQRRTAQGLGGRHAGHSATNRVNSSNRAEFWLDVSKSRLWDTEWMSVRPAPAALPELTLTPGTAFGIYVHVPFCATRCGYCDFNTYTAGELGGASPQGWLTALRTELELAAGLLGGVPVDTVFVGGGTPSLLGSAGLAEVLDAVRSNFALAAEAEVTTEANPESTSAQFFEQIRAAGYTRVSLGMQSVAPRVLAVLDRTHSPGRALQAAAEATAAGFDRLNIDLIYGTPGESDDDLLRSIDAALSAGIDHVSAYALVVEDGTALARRVRRGEIAPPDDDVLAHRYELLDRRLSAAGLSWYEVSNWSRPGGECRHNVGYWNGGQWWGAGPGAHGFVGDTRWWNVKHPNAYAERLAGGQVPVAEFERLDAHARHIEDVLLQIRLRTGLPLAALTESEQGRAGDAVAEDLLIRAGDRLVLTDRGRLLADAVVRDVLDD
jgi:putative oxygen-independent coproporphyrinogen III oxidase